MSSRLAILAALAALAGPATAQIRVTEWQYDGDEYVELTNVGTAPVDMTGWSFDDDSRMPGAVSLSAFSTVAPGKSVILCESDAAAFAANWRLTGAVIIGGNTVNLGRNDEINVYDANRGLVDRLTYGDQTFPGAIRAQDVSGSPCHGALGNNDAYAWSRAFVGDARGSTLSVGGQIGNPGSYVAIAASLTTYGQGCAGTGMITPDLSAKGCPTPGGQAIVAVANGQPSAFGILVFGTARAALPVGPCTVNVTPLLVVQPVALTTSGALTLPLGVPMSVFPGTITIQIFLLDTGVAHGFSATAGLELDIR
jgi:hypothetical protein